MPLAGLSVLGQRAVYVLPPVRHSNGVIAVAA